MYTVTIRYQIDTDFKFGKLERIHEEETSSTRRDPSVSLQDYLKQRQGGKS